VERNTAIADNLLADDLRLTLTLVLISTRKGAVTG